VPFYILTAVLLGVLAAGLTFTYLERLRADALPTGEGVVALEAIQPGTEITSSMVELREISHAQLPEGAILDIPQAVGRVAIYPIVGGEVLVEARLSDSPGAGLSARLPDGRWAMVLPGGWFITPLPGLTQSDHIDLVAYRTGDPQTEAGVIVSAIELLEFTGTRDQPERLTVAVTLDEAIIILYARTNGFSLLPLLRPEGS
jgi:Flp pilus assembly protein CpaB